MKTLLESLKMSLKMQMINEAFNQHTESFDELYSLFPGINVFKDDDITDDLKSFFDDLGKKLGDPVVFTYDENKKESIFKISYDYYEEIKELINTKYANRFYIKSDNSSRRKIQICAINKNTNKRSKILFVTGSGSKGVTTAQQETGTCLVWNKFVEETSQLHHFDLNDIAFIKGIVSEISDKFNNTWIRSFQKQITLIVNYMNYLKENYLNYRMDRSGEGDVGSVYGKYINDYSKMLGGKKDNFDPSDAILYDLKYKDEIINWYRSNTKNIKDVDSAINTRNEFKKLFFDTHKAIGISLKEITGIKNTGNYEEYNVDDNEKLPSVTKYNILHLWNPGDSANDIKIECECDINLDKSTTPNTNDMEIIGKPKNIILTMRRFGVTSKGDDVAIDAGFPGKPSLGKCPIRYWREIINARNDKNLVKSLEDFKNWLTNSPEDEIKKGLGKILLGSIKKGKLCFPFVIVH